MARKVLSSRQTRKYIVWFYVLPGTGGADPHVVLNGHIFSKSSTIFKAQWHNGRYIFYTHFARTIS